MDERLNQGSSVAAFVRLTAKQRAVEAIQLDRAVCLSRRDFGTFQAALAEPYMRKDCFEWIDWLEISVGVEKGWARCSSALRSNALCRLAIPWAATP